MKLNKTLLGLVTLSLMLGLTGGYWLARQSGRPNNVTAQAERKPLYYRHPMNPKVTSPTPAKDDMGMDYVAVYEENQPNAPSERKILYYRHPMGLPDTSPVPKKDGMGMDYLPVYAEDSEPNNTPFIQLSVEKIQKLGVKTAAVEKQSLIHTVRSVGLIETDERRLYNVTLRFDGYINTLWVNTTGQTVRRGQPLLDLYSPELVSAQQEYLTAKNTQSALNQAEAWIQSGMQGMADSSLQRLRNWGISNTELMQLENSGQLRHTLTVRAPASGIIMEKSVVAGSKVSAGEVLFKIADLSTVWVNADVYEQDLSFISVGQTVHVKLDAMPGQVVFGKVAFVYPMLNPETRTAKVRIELPNPKGLFKPMMYAQLEIINATPKVWVVPQEAILDSGQHTRVLVDKGDGRFEPRSVKLGRRGDNLIEILTGLSGHERVVTSANFLLDAESNLKAALGSFETATKPKPADHAGHGGQ